MPEDSKEEILSFLKGLSFEEKLRIIQRLSVVEEYQKSLSEAGAQDFLKVRDVILRGGEYDRWELVVDNYVQKMSGPDKQKFFNFLFEYATIEPETFNPENNRENIQHSPENRALPFIRRYKQGTSGNYGLFIRHPVRSMRTLFRMHPVKSTIAAIGVFTALGMGAFGIANYIQDNQEEPQREPKTTQSPAPAQKTQTPRQTIVPQKESETTLSYFGDLISGTSTTQPRKGDTYALKRLMYDKTDSTAPYLLLELDGMKIFVPYSGVGQDQFTRIQERLSGREMEINSGATRAYTHPKTGTQGFYFSPDEIEIGRQTLLEALK